MSLVAFVCVAKVIDVHLGWRGVEVCVCLCVCVCACLCDWLLLTSISEGSEDSLPTDTCQGVEH